MKRLIEPQWRQLGAGQRSRVRVHDTRTGQTETVAESTELVLEAPNWSPDGEWLLVNAKGALLSLPAASDSGPPTPLDIAQGLDANNDHVLSPDGTLVYVSSESTGRLFCVPLTGGSAREIRDDLGDDIARFVLGIAPDGRELYVTACRATDGRWGTDNVFALSTEGGHATRLTAESVRTVGADSDGSWLYVNSERDGDRPGHSRLFRFPRDGGAWQQLTHGDSVDWFGKIAPDGTTLAFVRYPPGTVGHEANRLVSIWTAAADGTHAVERVRLRGGQGTMNVNSWAPDSRRIAYIDYPYDSEL